MLMKFNDVNWPIALSSPIGSYLSTETGQLITMLSLMHEAQTLGDITHHEEARVQCLSYDPKFYPFSVGLKVPEDQERDDIPDAVSLFFPDPQLGTLSFELKDHPRSKILRAEKVIEWSWCDYHGETNPNTVPLNNPVEAVVASNIIAAIVEHKLELFQGLAQREDGIWVPPSPEAQEPADAS